MMKAGYEKRACKGILPWEVTYEGEPVARLLVENLADDLLALLRGDVMLIRCPSGVDDGCEES